MIEKRKKYQAGNDSVRASAVKKTTKERNISEKREKRGM